MSKVLSWFVRALLIVVCVLLTARSARIAIADSRAQQNGMDGLNAAIRLEPGDSVLLARAALFRNDTGDTSPDLNEQLLRAAQLDPFNSDVQIALGLREEFRGHTAAAERYLVHATEIDHTFKPAWTLAGFYARHDQSEESWPMIKRLFNLNPLAFDLTPVFDFCWLETSDSKKILDLIPAQGAVPFQYLYYLRVRNRLDAALELWPRVLSAASPEPGVVGVMTDLAASLVQANRVSDAVRTWNQLVDRGMVASGKLEPAQGISIADPDFRFPIVERGFGWFLTHEAGVVISPASPGLRFEFDGKEPESSQLLTTIAPLLPGRSYRLISRADAARLSSPRDPGFLFQVVQEPGDFISECPPMLPSGGDAACQFTTRPNTAWARLNLLYKRALGTTRAEGVLELRTVKLEFAS